MITVQYAPESILAIAVPDGRVSEFVNDLIEEHKIKGVARAKVSTGLVLDELRLRVSADELSHAEVRFELGLAVTSLNRYGAIMSGPEPREYGAEILAKISYNTMIRRRADRAERKEEIKAAKLEEKSQ